MYRVRRRRTHRPPQSEPLFGSTGMLLALSTAALASRDGSVVGLEAYGDVRGISTQSWRAFKGIPYAQPPVDALRFLPPEEPEPWSPGVLDATDFKPNCAQFFVAGSPFWYGFNLSIEEDCLYLN
eukprot:2240796-Prymnesium_polylepis.1